MKAFFTLFVASFFALLNAFSGFAVIDIKQIEEDAMVTKNLKEKITKAGENLEKEVNEARAKMEAKVANLQKLSATLSAEALEKKKVELQKEFLEIEQSLQEHDAAIQEAKVKALESVNQKVKEIAKKLSEKNSYEAVFASTFMIYYPSASDITKDVIKELNSEMKTINFEVIKKKNSKKK